MSISRDHIPIYIWVWCWRRAWAHAAPCTARRWRPISEIKFCALPDRGWSWITEIRSHADTADHSRKLTSVLVWRWRTQALAKSQILGGVRASVPRSTIITQGRQAITEPRGRYRVHNFSKPVTHKQKHRNWRISAQNVNVLKFTPITVSLPGNAVLRHITAHRSSTSPVICESQMFSGPQNFRWRHHTTNVPEVADHWNSTRNGWIAN